MKKIATLILNRNLPHVTDTLYDKIEKFNGDITDIYVVESGSNKDQLSKHCSWRADWDDAVEHGLRFSRGFNYGLSMLAEENKFKEYDYYFLVCNDAEFQNEPFLHILFDELLQHPRVGIISPSSPVWGENHLIGKDKTKYFWYVQLISWLMRREYIESVMGEEPRNHNNFLFDGTNFRGYYAENELVVKAYANYWATAITTKVTHSENETILKTKADLMKTEAYDINLQKVILEGNAWLRAKYGFNSRWTMQLYCKFFYEHFFECYPEYLGYKI